MAERDDWFVTYTGRRIFLLSPEPASIDIEDIAHALAHICRFGGHVQRFYSVAQHSVLVSRLVPSELALIGLLHDAPEAYVGDVIRPLKRQLGFLYAGFEDAIWDAICQRYGLPSTDMPPEVKAADRAALTSERAVLQPAATARALSGEWRWVEDERGFAPASTPIDPVGPESAKAMFLERWRELQRGEPSR